MAESTTKSSSVPDKIAKIVEVRANGRGWNADRYADLALFVLMYNRLKNNRTKIIEDLTDPKSPYYLLKTDTPENRKKLENVKTWYNMSSITGDELTWVLRDNLDYFNKAYALEMSPADINRISDPSQFKALYEYARELSAGFGHPDEMLSVAEMAQVMEEKAEKSRKVFEIYRKNVTSKGDNYYNAKDGHYEGGMFYEEWKNAERLYKQKTSETRRHGIKAWLFGFLGVGAAALTVTSFLSILPFAGISLGLGGAAGVVLGLAGTIAGGVLAKIGFGGLITKASAWWKAHKDKRDFRLGLGKYKDNDKGLPQSLKSKKDRYWNAHYIRSLFFNYRDLTYIQKEFQMKYIKEHLGLNKKYGELSASEKALVDQAFEEKYRKFVTVDASGKKKFNKDGIEKEYLRNCAYVKFKDGKSQKYDHKYTVTFEGEDLINNLWEELVNNYQVSAEGQTGWGGRDDLYWGRFAKVRYNLTHQPTEYAKERMTTQTISYLIDKHCKDKETDFETLKKDVTGLYELQEDFKKNNDLVTFKELKKQLSARMVEAFRSQILNKAFTETTVSDIRQMIEKSAKNQDLRNILEDPGEGDNLDDIENILMWVDNETSAGNKANGEAYLPFTAGIGVSIENQLFIRAENMMEGAKEINLEAANNNQATIMEIANRIEKMAAQDEFDEINDKITTMCGGAIETKQIGHFLQVQLEKRKEEVSYGSADSIAKQIGVPDGADVAKKLSEMMDLRKKIDPSAVRVQIMNEIDDAHKQIALDILARQINAMEIRDRNNARKAVYDSVKANSYIGLQGKLAEIAAYTETDPEKVKEFYRKIVNIDIKDGAQDVINDPKIKDYLISKLRYRIYQLYKDEATSAKFNVNVTNADEVMTNIKAMFKNLNNHLRNHTLDAMQKENIMLYYEPYISYAMKEYLKSAEKLIASSDKGEQYKADILKMFNSVDQSGIKEYLDLKTPEAISFEERMNRIRNSDVGDLFVPGALLGWGGFKYKAENMPAELKSTTYSYFRKNRGDDDELHRILLSMKGAYGNANNVDTNCIEQISSLPKGYAWEEEKDAYGNLTGRYKIVAKTGASADTESFTNPSVKVATNEDASFVFKVMSNNGILSQIDKLTDKNDKLIALTVLKRRIAGIVAGQIAACRTRVGSENFTRVMNGAAPAISKAWNNLTVTVDSKIAECLKELGKDLSNASYINNVKANTNANVGALCNVADIMTSLSTDRLLKE